MRLSKATKMVSLIVGALCLTLGLGHAAPAFQEQLKMKAQAVDAAKLSLTAFTYQGQLKDAAGPVTGVYDFQFTLYSAQTDGDVLGVSEIKDVPLANGMFNLKLDFGGAAVEAKESWLEIGVRPSGGAEAYTVLFPRQKLTPTPYAIFAQHDQWSLIGVPVGFVDRSLISTVTKTEETTPTEKPNPGTKGNETAAAAGTANYIAKFDGAGNATANSIMFDDGANVGIGTISPTAKLDVRGHLTLEAGGSPIFYTGSAPGELSRYLQLINSPSSPSASGLKAGGILVSDSYSYANPGKNDMVVKGNVGIGTPTPNHRLSVIGGPVWTSNGWSGAVELENASAIAWKSNAAGQRFGLGHTGGGFYIFRTASNPGTAASPALYDFVINDAGNTGIGNLSPQNLLHVGPGFSSIATSRVNAVVAGNSQDAGIAIAQGNGVNVLLQASGAGGYIGTTSNHPLVLRTRDIDQLVIRTDGTTTVKVLQILGGSDLSEQFEVSPLDTTSVELHSHSIAPGTVVAIDPSNPGKLIVSGQAYDRRVAGIISGAGGIKPGMVMGQEGSIANGAHPVALTGRVYCWADATNGPIETGDLLTTSYTPGHAMKVKNHKKAQGAIIGKAMTGLKSGKGLVLVLVTLQ